MGVKKFRFKLNSHDVVARFDIEDERDAPENLGGLQVIVHITVDGEEGYLSCLQNEDDGCMYFAGSAAGMDDENEALVEALDLSSGDDYEADFLGQALAPILARGQRIVDDYLSSCVANDWQVSDRDRVTGYAFEPGVWFGGHTVQCEGDGYLVLVRPHPRQANATVETRCRLDAEMVRRLRAVERRYAWGDPQRVKAAFEAVSSWD
jgi:hypothetical protein